MGVWFGFLGFYYIFSGGCFWRVPWVFLLLFWGVVWVCLVFVRFSSFLFGFVFGGFPGFLLFGDLFALLF